MTKRRLIVVALVAMSLLCLAACGDEAKVYDWQRPHDTYLVGSFLQSAQADSARTKLQRAGYDCRLATELKNGELYYNLLVDVYDVTPDTLSRLEGVTGVKPIPQKSAHGGVVSKDI